MLCCHLKRSAVEQRKAVNAMKASISGKRSLSLLGAFVSIGALSEAAPKEEGT